MVTLFDSADTRKELVSIMQEIAKAHEPEHARLLKDMMTPPEIAVQDYVDELGFKEGAWYRPAHNKLVPAAMMAICHQTFRGGQLVPRDLVYVAQMHDAGNSYMAVAATTQGADWESVDKRWGHMGIGAGMLAKKLNELRSKGVLEMDDRRIADLYLIAATHDFPYLGTPFKNPRDDFGPLGPRVADEALAHRDADRAFVMSTLSFWKDLVAQMSDKGYERKANELGYERVTPELMFRARTAFFYDRYNSDEAKPQADEEASTWVLTGTDMGYDILATYNEGGKVERMSTRTGQRIVRRQFSARARELEQVADMSTPKQFGDMFATAFDSEMRQMFRYAREGV